VFAAAQPGAAVASVPEPSSHLILLVTALVLPILRRRTR
jgi:hypothetical protein